MKQLIALAAVLLTLLVASCSSTGEKDAALATASPETVRADLDAFTRTIHRDLGVTGPALTDNDVFTQSCDERAENQEDAPFQLQAIQQVPYTTDHLAALQQLRDSWKTAGWKNVKYHPVDNGTGRAELSGADPNSRYTVVLTSGRPPTVLRLIVSTHCFRRPASASS